MGAEANEAGEEASKKPESRLASEPIEASEATPAHLLFFGSRLTRFPSQY